MIEDAWDLERYWDRLLGMTIQEAITGLKERGRKRQKRSSGDVRSEKG